MLLPDRVLDALRAALPARSTLVVAVSGGLDSVVLLDLLRHLAPAHGLDLHVAHLDHGIRGDAGAADAAFVRELAARWQIPATIEAADVPAWAAAHRLGLEAAARQVRYRCLAVLAARLGSPAVATAHTADDQVETLLLHALRGAGPAGWRGMAPDTRLDLPAGGVGTPAQIRLLRPLLTSSRGEVAAWAAERRLTWVVDATNEDRRFTRNRLRHEVLPALDRINPRWRAALLRTARLIADEHQLVECLADAAWPLARADPADRGAEPGSTGEADGVSLSIPVLAAQPVAVRRLLLRRAARIAGDATECSMERIEAGLGLLGSQSGKAVELGGGVVVERAYDRLLVRRLGRPPATGDGCPVPLTIPGETLDPHGRWRLRATLLDPAAWRPDRAAPERADLDADALGAPLAVRRWRPGDRLQPLGMRGIKKLHDLLIDAKVPRAGRHDLHVLVAPRGIAWAIGLRIADWAKVTPETRRVLRLEYERTE